jgi:anti-sigma-K factor RskA
MGVSIHRDEHLEMCAALALGSIDEEDRRILERHLAEGCPECERALADFSSSVVALAASSPAMAPSPAMRARVLDAVKDVAPGGAITERSVTDRGRVLPMERRRMSRSTWAWAAAAAALAVVTMLQWNAAERLRADLAQGRKQLADLELKLAEERRWAEVMSATDARAAELVITPAGVQALKARAVYDPRTKNAVIVFENFTPPAGKDYELWAMRPDGVASLGVVKTDAEGRATMRLENLGAADTLSGFAISLEPQGGSPNPRAPSGPVVMVGKLGG